MQNSNTFDPWRVVQWTLAIVVTIFICGMSGWAAFSSLSEYITSRGGGW